MARSYLTGVYKLPQRSFSDKLPQRSFSFLVNIGKVITVEDAYIINGLGSAVSEVCAGMGKGIVKRIGVQDWFGQSGPYDKLLEINGITKEGIVRTAEELLR